MALGYNQKRSQLSNLKLQKTDNSDVVTNISYDYYNGGGGSGGNNGRIRYITDHLDGNYSVDVGYDDHNRLTQYGSYRSYTYDAWNNLLSVSSSNGVGEAPNYTLTYATNASGAPSTNRINNSGYTFDNAGNVTNDGSLAYAYDAAGRLKTAGTNNSCEYDGDGRKVKQVSGGYPLFYLWSSVLGEPVVELDGSGGVYRAYVLNSGGQMLAVQSYDGGFYWLHTDHLGNGRKLTNASGAVIYRAEFDPHGQILYEWQSSGMTYLNSHKFTGYERDWSTNLNYAKARTYNHNRARFMQPDPLQNWVSDTTDPLSFNLYGYSGNDPMNFADPDGQIPIAAAIIGASALVGGAIEAYRCTGCTARQRLKAFGIGALAGAISGTAAVFGAAAGTVLGAAVAGGVGGAASTLVGNRLKNGKLTSSDAYQALTSGVVGGLLAGGAQWGTNFFFPASNSLNGTNLFSASLSSNSYSSQWSIYKDNLFRLFVSSNISRGLREMGNSVIPNTAAAVLQPLAQPSFDNIVLPIITSADYLVPSFADVFGANWNRFLQMAAWSQRIQFLGCYNQGDYRICVSFQSVGQLGN